MKNLSSKYLVSIFFAGIFMLAWSSPTWACDVGILQTQDRAVKLTLRQATAECSKGLSSKPSEYVAGDTLAVDIKVDYQGKGEVEIKRIGLMNAINVATATEPRIRKMSKNLFFADNIQFATTGDWTLSIVVQRGKKAEIIFLPIYVKPNPNQVAKIAATPIAVPKFSFKDPSGRGISNADLKGKVWVVDFFFASCPMICPTMQQKMAGLQKTFQDAPNFRTVSVTTDPETDTPEKLAKYAQSYKADTSRWHFLRGPKKDVVALSNNGLNLGAANDSIMHSTNFVVVDEQGFVRGSFDSTKMEELEQLKVVVADMLKKDKKIGKKS